jgi:hypothetical protein
MGRVYAVLAKTKINPSPGYFPARLVVEDCENIHIHFRNIRIEMNDKEFLSFADTMTAAAGELRKRRDGKKNH